MFYKLLKDILDGYERNMEFLVTAAGVGWHILRSNPLNSAGTGFAPCLTSCIFVSGVLMLLTNLTCKWIKLYRVSTLDVNWRILIYWIQAIAIFIVCNYCFSLYCYLFLVDEITYKWSYLFFWKRIKIVKGKHPSYLGYLILLCLGLVGIRNSGICDILWSYFQKQQCVEEPVLSHENPRLQIYIKPK
ncbi:uncharacterized protein LOC119684104 isoform X2 [Teleopsis dalmanni]|uniref:uncharacterized protein LOC119684104 isoform X2 n=1 Tax=Teleopsis dalmanni TaxID=139649 RepID=UPI0018CD93B6|nr:uncharacterized protein LOC119684104 isoform X2 [Teleopsis dalmanni]